MILKIVRLWDMLEGWVDVTGPVSEDEAMQVWNEKTVLGTRNTKYEDGDYYAVFDVDTKMLMTPEYFKPGCEV